MARNTGAWITKVDTGQRDDRGNPINRYAVGWYEISRDDNGLPIPRDPNVPDGAPKLRRCGENSAETFDTYEDARARRDEVNVKVMRNLSPAAQRAAGDRPLSHYAQAYFDGCEGNIKPKTLAGYRDNYRRYLLKPLGDKAVASITTADVRALRADLLKPRPRAAHVRPKGTTDEQAQKVTLSRSTVKHATETLRRILDVAVTDGAITANPCAALPVSRGTEAKTANRAANVLTEGQVAAVADHIATVQGQPIYGLVVLFAAYTGLRMAELAGLNVGDLWLPNSPGADGSVTVDRQREPDASVADGDFPGWRTGSLKTPKSYRTVPIDGWLADDLRAYLANDHGRANDLNAPLFPGRYGRAEKLPAGLIRSEIEPLRRRVVDPNARRNRAGEVDRRYAKADPHALAEQVAPSFGYKWSVPVNLASLAKNYFDPAMAALGIARIHWHDLRGTFAAISLTNGEHYMRVSEWLGHESYVTTMTRYAAFIPKQSGKAAPLRRPVAAVGNVVSLRSS